MATMYWTLWTRDPMRLQEQFPHTTFLRLDRIEDGVHVFLLENDDPALRSALRRATCRLLAANIILHCTRSLLPPGSPECSHESDETMHHYATDEWVVTDDRLHKVVNYFKADRCDVMWKYAEVDFMTFHDGQAARAEVQRRIANYQAEDAAGLS